MGASSGYNIYTFFKIGMCFIIRNGEILYYTKNQRYYLDGQRYGSRNA